MELPAHHPYAVVQRFEEAVAAYAGSPFAVAVDSCSAALFLCCSYLKVTQVTIPCRTYPSVPAGIIHAGGSVRFEDVAWSGAYQLKPYPIWDCALRTRRGMYVPGALCCLSFHYKKHLPIGKGGMILTDDANAVEWLKLARFNGRHEVPLMEDTIEMLGWNFTMDPERAARGLMLLSTLPDDNPDRVSEYPDLSQFPIYGQKK